MLQSIDNVPEIKYIFGYMSKTTGFTNPEEYKFQEDKQFIFEGILYSALTLYNNGGASRSKSLINVGFKKSKLRTKKNYLVLNN